MHKVSRAYSHGVFAQFVRMRATPPPHLCALHLRLSNPSLIPEARPGGGGVAGTSKNKLSKKLWVHLVNIM